MDKRKLVSIMLAVCFVVSLLFNVYFLYSLSRLYEELTYYHSLSSKKVSLNDIGIFWNNWNIFPQENSNVYYAVANFKIVNYGEVSACVIVAIEVKHEGQTIYEWFKTGEGSRVGEPVVRYGYFIIPPAEEKNCSMSFSFLNPEKLDTYLFISVVEAFPVS